MNHKTKKNPNFVLFYQRGQQGERSPCCPFLLTHIQRYPLEDYVMLFIFEPPEKAWTVFWLIYLNYSTCFKDYAGVNCKKTVILIKK
jgi:hypothetical protein